MPNQPHNPGWKSDPRIAAIQRLLYEERGAGRMIFGLEDEFIAKMLAVADAAAEGDRMMQITRETANA